ncbi:hypothetical protein AKJ64_03685 [candidate division MSBL1 archaeon SCGC-AAA259E17]|uniref:histidine kinase n=1 Tax=candidate division MSBL1 archaeon SCGC-AAA259E17 TaxID=1698263 RepID=A0A133UDG8_9EURY|nr:hypothetical protein AKJ64_03685 [candidate division MSBL1 archaeon SCGC-AAA259E17]
MLEENDYDAVVSGYQMSGMDGLEFLETVREDRESDIPFIVFTGKGREEVAMEALNLGADRYLQKGEDPKSQYGVLADAIVDEVEHREVFREMEKLGAELSSLVEGSDDSIYIVDEDCRFIFANEEELDRHGMKEGEMTGRSFHDLHPEEESQEFEEKVEKVLKTGEPERQETTHEGGERYLVRTLSPVENPETGEVNRVSVISKDITERKEMENKLRESEEKYRTFFEKAGSLVIIQDSEFKEVNPKIEELFGFSEDELVGMDSLEIVPEEERNKVRKNAIKMLKGEREDPYEHRIIRKDGETRWLVEKVSPIQYEGKPAALTSFVDVTERKKAEEEARKERERYEELFEGANEFIVTTDKEGYVKRVNERVKEFSGYSEDELIGESILKIAHPDDEERYIEFWKRILDGESPAYELKGESKDGSTTHIIVRGRPIVEDGEVVEIQYNAQDITQRKRAENRRDFLHSLLRHDLRNKIQVVRGFLELMEDFDLPEEAEDYLEKASKGIRGGMTLIEKVKTLRKIEDEEVEEVDLEPLIRGAVESCKSTTSEMDFLIEVECSEEGCKVEAGPLLEAVFSNLLGNSVQHSGGSKVRISNESTDGEMVCIIEDDGKGIPDEEKDKIFEKGYKKGENAGTGLGMYLVKEITDTYGGSVEVRDSELGGARFDVHLKKA